MLEENMFSSFKKKRKIKDRSPQKHIGSLDGAWSLGEKDTTTRVFDKAGWK